MKPLPPRPIMTQLACQVLKNEVERQLANRKLTRIEAENKQEPEEPKWTAD